jgi:hypothetical protein
MTSLRTELVNAHGNEEMKYKVIRVNLHGLCHTGCS